jgi:hypothetical protein
MIVLIRPVNAMVIFGIPFVLGNFREAGSFIRKIVDKPAITILASGFFILILAIQLILWNYQTGSFFIWPYKGEGFDFLNPHIYGVLFSFRKGLFIYTPFFTDFWVQGTV